MNKWDEKKLDQELTALMEEMPEQEELTKKIEQSIRKKVKKIVYRTIAYLIGIIVVLLLIINPFMNLACFNPYKLNQGENSQMLKTLKSYYETTRPYASVIALEVEKKGFARYGLNMQIENGRNPIHYMSFNVRTDMFCGNYKNWNDAGLAVNTFYANRFEMTWNDKEEYIEKIKELPASALIYLSVGEKDARELEQLRKENVQLNWIEVYQPNVDFQGGLSMWDSIIAGNEKSRPEMNMEELKETYLANLEDLLANPEIWQSLELFCSQYVFSKASEMDVLKRCYEDAKELETLKCKNYCISGKRDEIVAYLEKTDVVSLLVDEIKLSELDR